MMAVEFRGALRPLEVLKPFGCQIALELLAGRKPRLVLMREGEPWERVEVGDWIEKRDGRLRKVREDTWTP